MSVTFYPNTTSETSPSLSPKEGDECLVISVGPASSGYIEQDCSECALSFVQQQLYLPSGDLSSGNSFETLQLLDSNEATVAYIKIYNDDSDNDRIKWTFCCYYNGAMQATLTQPEEIVLDWWNTFQYKYDTDNNSWEVVLGEVSRGVGDLSGVVRTPKIIRVGVINSDEDTETIELGIDHVVWDNNHWMIPIDKRYSKGNYTTLPIDSNSLDEVFPHLGYDYVETNDDVYQEQECNVSNDYAVKLFNDSHSNNTDYLEASWIGKSNVAPHTSTIFLQVYNYNSESWETIDSDSNTATDVETCLGSTLSFESMSNYYKQDSYDSDTYWTAFRVYQQCV
jgi:hypothetical protein